MLRITYDRYRGTLTLDEAFGSTLRRSGAESVEIILKNDLARSTLASGEQLLLVLKPEGKHDDSLLVNDGAADGVLITDAHYQTQGDRYVRELSLFTDRVDALLGLGDDDAANDEAAKNCDLVICYRPTSGDAWRPSARLEVELEHGVHDPEDGSPVNSVDDPDDQWVAHGHAQTLTTEQKDQARENIGITADESAGELEIGAVTIPIPVALTNQHIAFKCPDGATRYIPLLNTEP
jgi:hypothetical protein